MKSDCLNRVLAEHGEDAGPMLESIQAAPRLRDSHGAFGILCHRCEAHLDALRIAGDEGITIGQSTMDDDPEVAGVVALLLAEAVTGQPESAKRAVALLCHESPEICRAAWWGLRLAKPQHIEPHLRGVIAEGERSFASAAALDILAFQRKSAEWAIEALPEEAGDDIAWFLAEAGGRIPGVWKDRHLAMFLGHRSPRVREAALRAAARSGQAGLPQMCREAADRMKPTDSEAISFLGVVGEIGDKDRLIEAVRWTDDAGVALAALDGLGRLGLCEAVPFLLETLARPEVAGRAAAAIERITGAEVPKGPPPEPPAGLSEDELDFWEPEAPVDADAAAPWWQALSPKFDATKRHQAGLCVSDDPLGPVFDELPLAFSYDVYLRERALSREAPDWELETWIWKQRKPGSP
jgi:hypothetical protein